MDGLSGASKGVGENVVCEIERAVPCGCVRPKGRKRGNEAGAEGPGPECECWMLLRTGSAFVAEVADHSRKQLHGLLSATKPHVLMSLYKNGCWPKLCGGIFPRDAPVASLARAAIRVGRCKPKDAM